MRKLIVVMLSMIVVMTSFMMFNVSAITVFDIPDDVVTSPHALTDGYENWVYVEAWIYEIGVGLTNKNIYYFAGQNAITFNLIDDEVRETNYFDIDFNGSGFVYVMLRLFPENPYGIQKVINTKTTYRLNNRTGIRHEYKRISKGGNVTLYDEDDNLMDSIEPMPSNTWGTGETTAIFNPVLRVPFIEANTVEEEHPDQSGLSKANDIINNWQQNDYIMFHDKTTDNNYLYFYEDLTSSDVLVPTAFKWQGIDTFGSWDENHVTYNESLKLKRTMRGGDVLYWQVNADGKSWWQSDVEDDNWIIETFDIDLVYFSSENVNAKTGTLWWSDLVWVIKKGEFESTVWADDWSQYISDGVNFQEGDLNQYESLSFTSDYKEINMSFTIKSIDNKLDSSMTNADLIRNLKFYFSGSDDKELTYRNLSTFYYKFDSFTDTFYGMGTFTVKLIAPDADILDYVITLNVRNDTVFYGSDTFTLDLYAEFIDTNYDGLDDNTGLPENELPDDKNNWNGSEGGAPPPSVIPSGDINDLNELTFTDSVLVVKNSVTGIQGVISSLLTLVPPDIAKILWAGFVILFVLAIVKLVF
ncbi:MAG: hypothetical protein PHT03_08075 [Bacilli bacterium]|nr:hypothetical protein [Bacilli bacterium]